MLCDPLKALAPLHPPDAVQEVAFEELHVSVDAEPLATERGVAVSVSAAAPATVTVAVATALAPLAPLQVSEYVVPTVSGPVDSLPLSARVPLQPPDAVHEVAPVALQVSVEAPPPGTVGGAAVIVAVGRELFAGLTPPPPQAASTKNPQSGTVSRRYRIGKHEFTAI